jgi:hypothetical protein
MPGLASLDFPEHSAPPPPNLPGFAPLRGLNGRCEGRVKRYSIAITPSPLRKHP